MNKERVYKLEVLAATEMESRCGMGDFAQFSASFRTIDFSRPNSHGPAPSWNTPHSRQTDRYKRSDRGLAFPHPPSAHCEYT
jgi:hypothetical protein